MNIQIQPEDIHELTLSTILVVEKKLFFLNTEQSAPLNQAISSNYSLKSVSYINYLYIWFFLFLFHFLRNQTDFPAAFGLADKSELKTPNKPAWKLWIQNTTQKIQRLKDVELSPSMLRW